jgi:outer membrane lipoprotein carrier protein
MMRAALLLSLLTIAPATAGAQSAPPRTAHTTVDRAAAAWAQVRTARGSFEQTVSNALTGGTATARGTFQQERPNRIAIRFTDPQGDAIIADGHAIWFYLPSSAPGQVIKRPATDRAAVPIDLVGQFLDDPHTRYEVTDGGAQTVDGRATRMLRLAPKAGVPAPFTRATVWVDDADAIIRQFEVVEASGVTRRIRMVTLSLNQRVDRNAFTFTPPRGVRVVDQTR